jgi:hypothetical protein
MANQPKSTGPKNRCAIYTRKSCEEGLDLEFNSLHAQRESAEAFSHAKPGWTENFGWPGIVLIETQDDAAIFANEQDKDGVRYTSRIQTWIELNADDALQRETAKDLYQTIIKASKAWSPRLELSTLKFIPT